MLERLWMWLELQSKLDHGAMHAVRPQTALDRADGVEDRAQLTLDARARRADLVAQPLRRDLGDRPADDVSPRSLDLRDNSYLFRSWPLPLLGRNARSGRHRPHR